MNPITSDVHERLAAASQTHLLRFLSDLNAAEQDSLLHQIRNTNLNLLHQTTARPLMRRRELQRREVPEKSYDSRNRLPILIAGSWRLNWAKMNCGTAVSQ